MRAKRTDQNGVLERDLTKELGLRIVGIRKRRGWSQAHLAARLGVSRERLGRWERGLNAPLLGNLSALSQVLEVPLEELGLGRGAKVPISAMELKELTRYVLAMERVLKSWMGRGKE